MARPPLYVRSRADYALLSTLTELDPTRIWGRTLHRYTRRLMLPDESASQEREEDDAPFPLLDDRWLTLYMMGQDRKSHRKICPCHWRDDRTLILPWAVRYMTACPTHQTLLVDRCVCGEKLRFDPRVGTCYTCGGDVGALEAPSIADDPDSLALVSLVWTALGHGDADDGSDAPDIGSPGILMLPVGHPLEGVTPAAFFRFATVLVNLLAARDRRNPFFAPTTSVADARPIRALHQANNASVHVALLCVWRLIAGWPATWEPLLLHIAAVEQRRPNPDYFPYTLLESLPGPDFAWLWRAVCLVIYAHLGRAPGVFRWLKFYHHVRRTLDPTLPRFRNLAQVGRALGVSRDVLERHVAAGDLEVRQGFWGEHGRLITLVDEECLAHLERLRVTQFNYAETVHYLGVGYRSVADLVQDGIIPGAQQGTSPKSPWLFQKTAIDEALRGVMGHLPVRRHKGRANTVSLTLTLAEALSSFRSAGIGLLETLYAVQRGDLPAFRNRDSVRLCDLRFDADAVDAYRSFHALHAPRENQARYTSSEVCRILRCTQVTLRLWTEAGLLCPLGTPTLEGDGANTAMGHATGIASYDGGNVDRFRETYMGTEEAATALGCTPQTLYRWTHAGKLDDALVRGGGKGDVFLFDRVRLDEIVTRRVTGAEAARLLGINVKTINNWVARGNIVPTGDPTAKGRRYLRDDVLQLTKYVGRQRG